MVQIKDVHVEHVGGCWVSVTLSPELDEIHVDFTTAQGVTSSETSPPFNPNRLYRFIDASAVPEKTKQHAFRQVTEAVDIYRAQIKAMQRPADELQISALAAPSSQPFTAGWCVAVLIVCGWAIIRLFCS